MAGPVNNFNIVFLIRKMNNSDHDSGTVLLSSMGSLLSFYCQFFATQITGGAKELVVLFMIKWQHLI